MFFGTQCTCDLRILLSNLGIFALAKDINPLTPTVAKLVQLLKHHLPDRVKPSFVIFDIQAL